jgi:hypothetical protein
MSASPAADLLPAMTPRSQRRVGASVRAVSLDSLGGGRWGGDANATRGGAAEGVGGSLRRLVRRGFFFPSFLRVLFARILGVCRRVCLCARATSDANLFVF